MALVIPEKKLHGPRAGAQRALAAVQPADDLRRPWEAPWPF